jgi:hypothetical protein
MSVWVSIALDSPWHVVKECIMVVVIDVCARTAVV